MSFMTGFSDSWDNLMTSEKNEQSRVSCMVRESSSPPHNAWKIGKIYEMIKDTDLPFGLYLLSLFHKYNISASVLGYERNKVNQEPSRKQEV